MVSAGTDAFPPLRVGSPAAGTSFCGQSLRRTVGRSTWFLVGGGPVASLMVGPPLCGSVPRRITHDPTRRLTRTGGTVGLRCERDRDRTGKGGVSRLHVGRRCRRPKKTHSRCRRGPDLLVARRLSPGRPGSFGAYGFGFFSGHGNRDRKARRRGGPRPEGLVDALRESDGGVRPNRSGRSRRGHILVLAPLFGAHQTRSYLFPASQDPLYGGPHRRDAFA